MAAGSDEKSTERCESNYEFERPLEVGRWLPSNHGNDDEASLLRR